ncbi:MAG: SRPBCC family protein [Ignavibacteriaceae bacterium]|nr:SRPBCC family protein [Ignavibacteriaceae bacterium]
MPKIITTTEVDAPIDIAFDLTRSIDFHAYTQTHRNEVAIKGRTSGLINLGEVVTWRAKHFGINQKLSVKITKLEQPFIFRDTMIEGAFKRFDHDHIFEQHNGRVKITEVFDYESPLSFLGRIFNFLILKNYMTKFFVHRNEEIKSALESDKWRDFLN